MCSCPVVLCPVVLSRPVEYLVNEQFDLKEITEDFMRVIGEAAHDEEIDLGL